MLGDPYAVGCDLRAKDERSPFHRRPGALGEPTTELERTLRRQVVGVAEIVVRRPIAGVDHGYRVVAGELGDVCGETLPRSRPVSGAELARLRHEQERGRNPMFATEIEDLADLAVGSRARLEVRQRRSIPLRPPPCFAPLAFAVHR